MEELNKQKSISMRTMIVAIAVLVLVVAGASAVYFVMNKDEGAENNTVSNSAVNNTASVNTTTNTTQAREVPSGMKLYEKKDFGFSLYYPSSYDTNKDYSIWTANIENSQNNFQFGINKFQETIFNITAYKKVEEAQKIADLKSKVVGDEKLSSGLTASVLNSSSPDHYLIEKDSFVYAIGSSYANPKQASSADLKRPEWDEFKVVLNSLMLQD